ncbi:hypothetical protein E2986_11669 [Frieseomelitta varia]|uniref:Uncharacterized protein n=1 Tax=Frieseomelitta varia TaxID=561572 RepID=A0A833SKG6_9HYME|nr:hypothetical protein E2986_11669 [Frieseomelitta varia]
MNIMHVSRSAYDLIWYKQTLNMQKNLLNVLSYQKPVTFSISFIVPDLSLRYYCSQCEFSTTCNHEVVKSYLKRQRKWYSMWNRRTAEKCLISSIDESRELLEGS